MARRRLAWVYIDLPPDAHEGTRAFWERVLGEESVAEDGSEYAFLPTPRPVRVGIQRIGEGDAPRLHLDLVADDVQGESRALEELGATRVRDVDEHVIMRDPAGLLFCVVPSRWAADVPLPVESG